jgi:hypothetical protein
MSQNGQAGRDLIQAGRDYIRHIQVNILSGHWGVIFISLIPLILTLYIASSAIKWTVTTVHSQVQTFSGNQTLTGGSVYTYGLLNPSPSVSISARATQVKKIEDLVFFDISDIPFSEYQKGFIKLGQNTQAHGTINLSDGSYSTNVKDADLTLKLNANPTQKGEFVQGTLSGRITNGINSKKIYLKFVIPVQ